MKAVNNIGFIMQAVSGLVFASSFFIKDPEKAVNYRWTALGLVVGGTAVRYIATGKVTTDPVVKIKA